MKRLAAMLMIAMFIACGPHWTRPGTTLAHPGRIRVCLWLPDERLPMAHEAVTAWDHVLHKWNEVVAVDRPDSTNSCSLLVRTQDAPLYDRDGNPKNDVLAWCACVGCQSITLRNGHYEFDVKGILQHEMGHAFGAQHASGTLMDPYWRANRYVCPDRETVLQVAAWNRIDEDVLSWCQ